MILDANVLIYATDELSPFHDVAVEFLESALNGQTRVGFPWQTVSAFARIMTNPRVYASPLTPTEVWMFVDRWLATPVAWIPEPGPAYGRILRRLMVDHDIRGPLVTDALIAALAEDHGVSVASFDTDFARFTEIRWVNPRRTS
jgi:uncharacterized protein